jgi:hypothetical protein
MVEHKGGFMRSRVSAQQTSRQENGVAAVKVLSILRICLPNKTMMSVNQEKYWVV